MIRVSHSAKLPAFLTFYTYSKNVFKEGAKHSRDLDILTCKSPSTSEGLHNELNSSHSKDSYKDSIKYSYAKLPDGVRWRKPGQVRALPDSQDGYRLISFLFLSWIHFPAAPALLCVFHFMDPGLGSKLDKPTNRTQLHFKFFNSAPSWPISSNINFHNNVNPLKYVF